MAKRDSIAFSQFSGGLNTNDGTQHLKDSELRAATNILYRKGGSAYSIDAPLSITTAVTVDGDAATKCLGAKEFNGYIYAIYSNGVEARIFRWKTGDAAFVQVSATNFDPSNQWDFAVYDDHLYMVNAAKTTVLNYSTASDLNGAVTDLGGTPNRVRISTTGAHGFVAGTYITISGTTNYNGSYFIKNVDAATTFDIEKAYVSETLADDVATPDNGCRIYHINTSNTLSGYVDGGIFSANFKRLAIHKDRLWCSTGNSTFVTVVFPQATYTDWGSSTYTGADTAGVIIIDDSVDNEIYGIVEHFGSLAILRKDSIHYLQGNTLIDSSITKKTNVTNGVYAPWTISPSDRNIYYFSQHGTKIFTGVSVKEGATEFDSIISEGIDRSIWDQLEAISTTNRAKMIGIAHEDKYYLSDPATGNIFVFDEIVGSWSVWDNHDAQAFCVYKGELYCGNVNNFYKVQGSSSAAVTASLRTKDFNFGGDTVYKIPEMVNTILKPVSLSSDITLSWYINGSGISTGSKTLTAPSSQLVYDGGFLYDNGALFDQLTTEMFRERIWKRHGLRSCVTIAFGLSVTGTNKFELLSFEIIYEVLRKGI